MYENFSAVLPPFTRFEFKARSTVARTLGLVIIAVALITAACSPESAPNQYDYDGIFFPRQKAGVAVMDAILIGKLVEVEGCLRINDANGETSYLVVWPSNYSLKVVNGVIMVMDGAGKTKVRVGEEIFVSGGETKSVEGITALDDQLKRELSTRCSGPYWLVGSEVRRAGSMGKSNQE
ncbi:hypothetical protein L0337_29665 [candidate division KSB1 bacterium]|nr:hypothetical protein [candidate division KSB1 bacterium]